MSTKQTVLLLGATGETGGSILDGLLDDPESFHVEALVRPSSADKQAVKDLATRGVKIRVVDIDGPLDELVAALVGVDVVISTIDALSQLSQLQLATAAKQAGVKRFVPCAFTTVCPPGGIMILRDEKEQVYQHIWTLHLPYTIIDVGYWHQISFPPLPSGRVDYAVLLPRTEIYAGGTTPTMLTDLRDIGTYVARIIKDPRTLNKFVAVYGDVLSQNEVFGIMEEMSGETIERKPVSAEELTATRARWTATATADPTNRIACLMRVGTEYDISKHVRGDNTPAVAAYLGYLDARALYPTVAPRTFRAYAAELLAGTVRKPYPEGGVVEALLKEREANKPAAA